MIAPTLQFRHRRGEADEQGRAIGRGAGGRRAEAEGNAGQQSTRRAQNRENVSQALERIRQVARQRKKEGFTALLHHLNVDLLEMAFFELKRNAAPGVDGLAWKDYEAGLEQKLEDLHLRVQRGAYRALPSRRRYIPKPDGRQRPLAVAALEDKIVQEADAEDGQRDLRGRLVGFSYGFRPRRSQHDALDVLVVGLEPRRGQSHPARLAHPPHRRAEGALQRRGRRRLPANARSHPRARGIASDRVAACQAWRARSRPCHAQPQKDSASR